MRCIRFGLFSLCMLLGSAPLWAASPPPSPLRLVPPEADLLLEVPQPRRLVESVTNLDLLKQLQAFSAVREVYDSTNYRRFYQLVAYFEKQLGFKWPELLDRLSGGGAVLAVKLGPDPAPSLLVLQGTDEQLLRKFVKLSLVVAEQELARKEAKEKVERSAYRDIETIRIGPKFFAAQAGSALLIGNVEAALRRGIDLYLDGDKKSLAGNPTIAEAHHLLPPDPLVSLWLNMETVRKAPQAEKVFELPRDDANLTFLFGGWLDVARRSPFLCAGLCRQADGVLATVRLPRGREGMSVELSAHLPPADQPGSLPLLEPRGVLYSTSYFQDLSQFWAHRAKLLNEQQNKQLDEFDKNSSKFLLGNHFSELLAQVGPHWRIVVANQSGYRALNSQSDRNYTLALPAFAVVVDMRQPETFSKTMDSILRGAAFLAGTQVKLKVVEEKHGDHTIVGYRFQEDPDFKKDVNNVRFNYSPCFVRVGDQFVLSGTIELAHQLVDILDREAKDPDRKGSPASVQTRAYASGGAEVLKENEDQLLAQTILDQALSPGDAREQVRSFIDWVGRLGVLQIQATYGARDFHYDIEIHQLTTKSTKGTKEEQNNKSN